MRKLFRLIAFACFFHGILFAQKTDSLKRLYIPNLPDTQQYNIISQIGMSYYFNDGQLDSSLLYLNKAKTIANKTGILKNKVNSLLNYALVVREKGSFEKAMEDYFEALKLAEKANNEKMIASAYSGIAVVYSFQKDQIKAREYFNKALEIAIRLKDEKKLGSLNNNIGLTYMDDKNYPLALEYMLAALELQKQAKNDNGTAAAAENIGLIYDNLGEFKESMKFYTQAYKIWTSRNDVYSTAINLSYMAMHFNLIKDYTRARDTAIKALSMAKSVGAVTTQVDLHSYISDTYSGLKDFEKALYHFRKNKELSDSLKSDENIKAYTETQLKYSFYKQQLQDSLNYVMKVNKKEEQLKSEKTIRYFSFGAIAVFIILLFFLLKGYREKKAANQIILHQKNLVEEKQKEIIDSITYAKRIQTALLASDKLLQENLREHFVLFRPKDIVAGDFYWAAKAEDKFIYVTGDCTGHGVPGAFMSLLNTSILSETIKEKKITRPDLILNTVRKEIINALNPEGSVEESKDGMDCVVIVLDRKNNLLEYAGANNPFYIVRNNELLIYKPDKMPVGKSHDDDTPFTYNRVALENNDMIYTFSDGYADQFGGTKGKKFKYLQFGELLVTINEKMISEQRNILEQTFDSWKGDLQQVDDVCVIGVRV